MISPKHKSRSKAKDSISQASNNADSVVEVTPKLTNLPLNQPAHVREDVEWRYGLPSPFSPPDNAQQERRDAISQRQHSEAVLEANLEAKEAELDRMTAEAREYDVESSYRIRRWIL